VHSFVSDFEAKCAVHLSINLRVYWQALDTQDGFALKGIECLNANTDVLGDIATCASRIFMKEILANAAR
jgi:hypothetical protein